MDHDLAVGKRQALAGRSRCKQKRAHARRHTDADGRNVAFDIVHRIVDRHTGRDRTARTVDIKADILIRILRFKEKKLCHDKRRRDVVHLVGKKYDPIVEKSRINVVRALATARLLHNHWYQCHNNLLCRPAGRFLSLNLKAARGSSSAKKIIKFAGDSVCESDCHIIPLLAGFRETSPPDLPRIPSQAPPRPSFSFSALSFWEPRPRRK